MNNQNDIDEQNDSFEIEFQSLMKDLKSTVPHSKPSEERLQKRIQIAIEENRKLEEKAKSHSLLDILWYQIIKLKNYLLDTFPVERPAVFTFRLALACMLLIAIGVSFYLLTGNFDKKSPVFTKKEKVIPDTTKVPREKEIILPEETNYEKIVNIIQIDTILPKAFGFATTRQMTLPERISMLKELLKKNKIKIASDKDNKIKTEWFIIKSNQIASDYKSRFVFMFIKGDTSRIIIKEEKLHLQQDEKIKKELSNNKYQYLLKHLKKK